MTAAQRRRLRISRDSIIFTAGLAGFIYQITNNGIERPTYMIACLFMMGVPAFLKMDDSVRDLTSRRKLPDLNQLDAPEKVE